MFAYANAGSLALELIAWSSSGAGSGTRATALAYKDGVLVKSGDPTRRFVGTIRITGTTGQCEYTLGAISAGGTEAKLFVWNYYNRSPVSALVGDNTDSWSYASTAWRAANNSSTYRVSLVCGQPIDVAVEYLSVMGLNTGESGSAGIGLNSTTAPASRSVYQYGFQSGTTTTVGPAKAQLSAIVAEGFNYFSALEQVAAGTVTFIGDDGLAYAQTGLTARALM